jgi:hypothetical protein
VVVLPLAVGNSMPELLNRFPPEAVGSESVSPEGSVTLAADATAPLGIVIVTADCVLTVTLDVAVGTPLLQLLD